MDTSNIYGDSINLGVTYDPSIQDIISQYKNIDITSVKIESINKNILLTVIDKIINRNDRTFFVHRDSKYSAILSSHIKSGRIKICESFDFIFSNDNYLVFSDESDVSFKNATSMLEFYTETPPWIVTTKKLIIILAFLESLLPISNHIDNIKKYNSKLIYFFCCSNEEYILANLLILLCKNVTGVIFTLSHIFENHNPIEMTTLSIKNNIENRISGVILNAFGSSNRKYLKINKKMTYYFVFGNKKKQSNMCHDKKPFFVWFYPYAGTSRIAPVLEHVFNFLDLNFSCGLYKYHESHFKQSESSNPEENIILNNENIIKLFNTVPNNSYISLHSSVYHALDIIEETQSKIIILTRDMRDIVLSNINRFYGARLKYGGEQLEDIAIHFMQSKQAYPSAGHSNYEGGLKVVTQEILKLINNTNAYFLKFEDVHTNGITAYTKLFKDLGFYEDPFWIDELIIPVLKDKIFNLNPHNTKKIDETDAGHKLQYARPGGWKECFTPKMKNYFKQNSNDILIHLGYEKNSDW